jgi:hypothetical protein
MIKLQNLTPEVYYKESRDFQLLGRLFDLVLNAVKTDADLLYNLPLSTNSDEKLLELLALTLGFKPKHQYNARNLKAVCSVFSEILRNKGSINAIKIACEALFNSMDISQQLEYDFTKGKDRTELNLYIAQEFGDITLLNDLLSYILPAGMSCNIIREFHLLTESNTNIGISDNVKKYEINTAETSKLIKDFTNISDANIADKAGFSVNSEITKLEDKKNG